MGKLPKGFTLSLAHQFLDLMRSHRKEQKEPGLLVRRTVYLINCIFMIKSKTLRGQGAKDMGWISNEKLIPELSAPEVTQGQRGKWPRLWTDLFSLFPKQGTWVRAGGLEVRQKRKDPYGLISQTESKAAGWLFRRNGTFGDALLSGPTARRPQKETRQRRQLIPYSNVKTHIGVRRNEPLMKYRHSHWEKLNHCE